MKNFILFLIILLLFSVLHAKKEYMDFGSFEDDDNTTKSSTTTKQNDKNKNKHHMFGGYFSLGMATTINKSTHNVDEDFKTNEDYKPRFAGGFGFTYHYYLDKMIGFGTGLGIVGKGWREEYGGDEARCKFTVMEIPVGVMLNFSGFRAGVSIAFNFTLAGKLKWKIDGEEGSEKFNDEDWDGFLRFNIGPKIVCGYSIPVGPIGIFPSVSWTIDTINYYKGEYKDDYKLRSMNLMFNIGAEYGL